MRIISDAFIKHEKIKELYQINLQALPNQEFDITLGTENFKIILKTTYNGKLLLDVLKEGYYVVYKAVYINNYILNLHSGLDVKGAFFYAALTDDYIENLSYLDFKERVGLFYGIV